MLLSPPHRIPGLHWNALGSRVCLVPALLLLRGGLPLSTGLPPLFLVLPLFLDDLAIYPEGRRGRRDTVGGNA